MQHDTKPKIISLSAGAGLGELGSKLFFHTVLAVDSWWRACRSFAARHAETAVRIADIADELLLEWARKTYQSAPIFLRQAAHPNASIENRAGFLLCPFESDTACLK